MRCRRCLECDSTMPLGCSDRFYVCYICLWSVKVENYDSIVREALEEALGEV